MAKTKRNERDVVAYPLAEYITKFVNAVFGRRLGLLGPSRSLQQAIKGALECGYTQDEIRMAFWAARCIPGESWINKQLQGDLQPEIVLRHSGGMNKITGKPAARWLDDLIEKADEINRPLVKVTLEALPEEMIDSERELLKRVGVL